MHEDVPKSARIGLYHLVEQFFSDQYQKRYSDLYQEICKALRIKRERALSGDYAASIVIERLIDNCEWWQFYDICEVMWSNPDSQHITRPHQEKFTQQINGLFGEERLGYQLRDGKIEKVGSGFIDAKVQEARYLLKEPEYKGADEHFEKAIKALNVRPNPDVENCIKDAVAAIESVGRIIAGDEKALLSVIIKDMATKGVIPKPLDQVIQKIYAYRGDQPGVAHGMVGVSKVTVDEAEFVLAVSAATIIYLTKKKEVLQ